MEKMEQVLYIKALFDFGIAVTRYTYCLEDQQTLSLLENVYETYSTVLYFQPKCTRYPNIEESTLTKAILHVRCVHGYVVGSEFSDTILGFVNDAGILLRNHLLDYAKSKQVKDYFAI